MVDCATRISSFSSSPLLGQGRAVRRRRGARLPVPVPADELAVPPQQGVGLDDQ
jgi:hypothetical protein